MPESRDNGDRRLARSHPVKPLYALTICCLLAACGGGTTPASNTVEVAAVDEKARIAALPQGLAHGPYGGTERRVPGRLEVEDFDSGGEDVGYHDMEARNMGGGYRPGEGVDLEVNASGVILGWTAEGEWTRYTIDVAEAGSYDVRARVASPVGGASFHLELNGQTLATFHVPSTGGWQTYTDVTVVGVPLGGGVAVLKLVQDTGDLSIDYLEFTATGVAATRVAAVDSAPAPAPALALASASASAPVPPPASVNLVVTPGQRQLTVEWARVAGATSYHVYRALTPGGQGATPYRSHVNAEILFDAGLTAGTTYYYQVAAVNAGGVGPRTIEVGRATAPAAAAATAPSGATQGAGASPSASVNLVVTPGQQQLVVEWAAVAGATSYHVYRALTPGGQGATPYRSHVNAAILFDTGLTAGTTYYYQVAAVNAGGVGPRTIEVRGAPAQGQTTIIPTTTPSPPTTSVPSTSTQQLPVGPPTPGLKAVNLAAISKSSNLVLVNFRGDCNGLRARLFDSASRRFYGLEDATPCQNPTYAAPANLYSGLIARAISGQVPVYELLQSAAGQRLSTTDRIGDCRVSHLEVQDEYVGSGMGFITTKGCTQVGMTNDVDLPTRMVAHYVASGIEPIVAAEPYSPALTRCDKTVDPSNFSATLAGMSYPEPAVLNGSWQVICMKPGNYAGPFRLKNANHVMLVATPGTVTMKTNLPINPSVVGAPFELWYSSNVVMRGIQFENAHQFSYVNPDSQTNSQYSVGLYVGYVNGLQMSDLKIMTGGKEAFWMAGTSFARVKNSEVSGAYFALTMQYGALLTDNFKITTRHPLEPTDEHTMMWLNRQQMVMKNTTLVRQTGRGLISGESVPETDALFMKNINATSHGLDAWFQHNPNYMGLHINVSGIYPKDTADYFMNLYQGGGLSAGMLLTKQ